MMSGRRQNSAWTRRTWANTGRTPKKKKSSEITVLAPHQKLSLVYLTWSTGGSWTLTLVRETQIADGVSSPG